MSEGGKSTIEGGRKVLVGADRVASSADVHAQPDTAEREALLRALRGQGEELAARNASLEAINAVSGVVSSSQDYATVIERAARVLRRVTGAVGVEVWVPQTGPGAAGMACTHRTGTSLQVVDRRGDVLRKLTEIAVERKQLVSTEDGWSWDGPLATELAVLAAGGTTIFCFPLCAHDEVLGAIHLIFEGARAPTSEDRDTFLAIGRTVAMAMFTTRQIRRLEEGQQARAALEVQLHHSQRMEAVGRLAGGIAHEFNNMLTPILCSAEAALGEVDVGSGDRSSGGVGALREDLETIVASARRARELVSRILLFSKSAPANRSTVDVVSVLREGLRLAQGSLPESFEVQTDFPSEHLQVRADTGQLQQMLLNLVTNAEHAMGARGGVFSVAVDRSPMEAELAAVHPVLAAQSLVHIRIADSGAGMDEQTLARIFDPFFTTREVGQGTGLGLSVVHGIIVDHGGCIHASSVPGLGTTFDIYFPALRAAVATEPVTGTSSAERILVVDDEPAVARVSQRILRRAGYEVATAADAEEALAMFARNRDAFDLVLTDQTMPRLTGVELAGRLHALRPDLPVVLVTGHPEEKVVGARDAHLAGVLLKPFDAGGLSDIVRSALDRRQ